MERLTQHWRIEVAHLASDTRVFVDGQQVYPSCIDLKIEAGQRTMVRFQWPTYGPSHPEFHAHDTLIIVTQGALASAGDRADGLFGAR